MVTITLQGNTVSEIYAQMREFLHDQQVEITDPQFSPELRARAEELPHVPAMPPAATVNKAMDAMVEAEGKPARRKRRTKAEMDAARNPEESFTTKQHEPPPSQESEESAEDESPAIVQMQKQTTATAAPIANKEAVHQALQQVNVAVGLPKARDILQSFNVNRISELKENQFKPFIEKCNEAVMLEG